MQQECAQEKRAGDRGNMEYLKENYKDVLVFTFEGEFSAGNKANELINEIDVELRAGSLRFVFDFQRLTYINSSGVQVLIRIGQRVEKYDGYLAFINLPDFAKKILTQLGLFSHFPLINSLDDAITNSMSEDVAAP